MDTALIVTLGTAAAVLLVVLALLLAVLAGRRRLRRELAEAQARLEELTHQVEAATAPPAPVPSADAVVPAEREYVITAVGELDGARPRQPEQRAGAPIAAREFASVALGESLVRVVALGYGVRRALSAENRNRIGFEVRREVRRSRKQRRRDLKEAKRVLRTVGASGDAA
jgi:HAMP domain-containing protein